MDDEIPILEQAFLESDVEVLQEETSAPLGTLTTLTGITENPNAQVNRDTTQEGSSALDGQQPAVNDPPLPPDPPAYHDIIPLIDDGSNVPPPPPSTFKSLCFCFFGAYRLYYVRKIRNSRYMLILLVAFLVLPVSAIYMGLKYYDSCSVTPRTPFLLLLMGIVGVLLNILRIFTVISRSFEELGVCEPPRIIVEISVLLILCLLIAEMITFYQNIPVFDDPKNPLYCAELLHTYIFYMNFVVPTIGILALVFHIPMKPMNDIQRRLQEAERGDLRQQQQQQNIEGTPSQVYTAWIKPRRRISHWNEDSSEDNDSRLRLNAGTEVHDYRSLQNTEICVSNYRRTEEITIDGTVGDLQGDDGAVIVSWWDEAGAVSGDMRNYPWVQDGAVGGSIFGQMFDEEGAVYGAVGDEMFHEQGAVGGAVGDNWEAEESAVSGAIGGHRWDEEGAVGGAIEGHQWDERGTLDPCPRDRESSAFPERTAFRSHRWGEENFEDDISESRRWDEERDGLRSRRRDEFTKYGAIPKIKETNESGARPKRKESVQDDVNPQRTESAETAIRPLQNESSVESDAFETRWHELGARPKIKKNVECVPRTKRKEATEKGTKSRSKSRAEDSARPRQNESTETVDITLRNKDDAEIDVFGNQGNVRNEGGVRPKHKISGTRSKTKEGVESGARSKRKGNIEVDMEAGAESDIRSKMKGNTEVTMKEEAESGEKSKRKRNIEAETKEVVDSGALPKNEESTECSTTPKMKESTESSARLKRKGRTEDGDREKRKGRTEDGDREKRKERTEDDDTQKRERKN